MLLHDDKADFVECPLRIKSIFDYLNNQSLLESMIRLKIEESEVVQQGNKNLYPKLESVHTREQIARVEKLSNDLEEGESKLLKAPEQKWGKLFYCKETFMAAKLAADGCLTAVSKVIDKSNFMQRGYCIVRPPGHHARPDTFDGFCFFNNVALAAKLATDAGKRVLIFDWDIH